MIKDVLIKIKGIQTIDGSDDTIELTTVGKFGIRDNEFFISYDDGQMLDDKKDVKTKIFFKADNSVSLERNGAINSKMLIQEGKRNTCLYNTPLGDLVISIYGQKVWHNLCETGGNITLQYTIDSQMHVISNNMINITVNEVKE